MSRPTTEYRVVYEIDLEAASHEEAALTVATWMRDPESFLPCLGVTKHGETEQRIIDTGRLDWEGSTCDIGRKDTPPACCSS